MANPIEAKKYNYQSKSLATPLSSRHERRIRIPIRLYLALGLLCLALSSSVVSCGPSSPDSLPHSPPPTPSSPSGRTTVLVEQPTPERHQDAIPPGKTLPRTVIWPNGRTEQLPENGCIKLEPGDYKWLTYGATKDGPVSDDEWQLFELRIGQPWYCPTDACRIRSQAENKLLIFHLPREIPICPP